MTTKRHLIEGDVLRVAKGGAAVGTRRGVNLIEGANVTLTVADNPGADRVDVTVAAAAAAAGAGVVNYNGRSGAVTPQAAALIGALCLIGLGTLFYQRRPAPRIRAKTAAGELEIGEGVQGGERPAPEGRGEGDAGLASAPVVQVGASVQPAAAARSSRTRNGKVLKSREKKGPRASVSPRTQSESSALDPAE